MTFDLAMLILVICGVIVILYVLDKGYEIAKWVRKTWDRVNLGAYRANRRLWEK